MATTWNLCDSFDWDLSWHISGTVTLHTHTGNTFSSTLFYCRVAEKCKPLSLQPLLHLPFIYKKADVGSTEQITAWTLRLLQKQLCPRWAQPTWPHVNLVLFPPKPRSKALSLHPRSLRHHQPRPISADCHSQLAESIPGILPHPLLVSLVLLSMSALKNPSDLAPQTLSWLSSPEGNSSNKTRTVALAAVQQLNRGIMFNYHEWIEEVCLRTENCTEGSVFHPYPPLLSLANYHLTPSGSGYPH